LDSSSIRKPRETILIPCFSIGRIISSIASGFSFIPNIIGIFGPFISASRIPTLYPSFLNETARLDVTVDFQLLLSRCNCYNISNVFLIPYF